MPRIDLRRSGRLLLVALSFIFLGATLLRHREQLGSYDWDVAPVRLLLSIGTLATVLTVSVGIWGLTLRRFGTTLPFATLARIWFLSNVARYIPGKIWQFVGVAEMSRAASISALTSVTSLLLYMGVVLLAALLLGIYLIPAPAAGPLGPLLIPLRVGAPMLLIVLHPRVVNAVIRWTARLTRRPLAVWEGRWKDGMVLFALCVGEWVALGVAFHLFVGSLVPLTLNDFPTVTAAFSLSFVAGYVAMLPAGLGAKEGAIAVLLSTVMPFPAAAAIAIGSRVWMIAAELLPVLVFIRPGPSRLSPAQPSNTAPSNE